MTYFEALNQRSVLLFELQQANDELEMNSLGVRLDVIDRAIEVLRTSPVRPDPTPEQWKVALTEEREYQRSIGYDEEHDRAAGIDHLLWWSQEYARQGQMVESAALVEAARAILTSEIPHRWITIPRPHVPYGPDHVSADEADADYLREAADTLVYLRSRPETRAPWGSNVTETIRILLVNCAEALHPNRSH